MPVLLWIIFIIEVSAILIGFAFYKYLGKPYRIVHIQVIAAFAAEVTGRVLMENRHTSNVWVFNIYFLLEVLLLVSAAYYLINRPSLKKPYLVVLSGLVLAWITMFFFKGIGVVYSPFFISYSFLLVVLYLYAISANHLFKTKRIYTQPMFVLCLAMIIYFGGVMPLFGTINVLNRDYPVLAKKLFYINKGLVGLRYALVALTFWLCAREGKTTSNAGQ